MIRFRITPRRFQAYGRRDIDRIPELRQLSPDEILAMKAVSAVLPFRVKTHFGERTLIGYELLRVVDQGPGETVIVVRLIFAGGELQEKAFEMVKAAGEWVIAKWQWL